MSAVIKNLELAWQNDSFYVQTTSRNAANISKAGVAGCIAGRITGVISPRDGAIYSMAGKVSDIFVKFIENKFVKEPLLSDEGLEKDLRWLVRIGLSFYLSRGICSLTRVRGLEIFGFNKATMRFVCVEIAINVVLGMTFKALFSSPEPEGAS